MDRFIVKMYGCIYLRIIDLKSNMDRFIEYYNLQTQDNHQHLKSNMDRFIAAPLYYRAIRDLNLKSNMDRFIDFIIITP